MSDMADAIEAAAKALWDVDRTRSDREYEECREGTKRHLRREVGAVIAALSAAGFGPVQAARAEALREAADDCDQTSSNIINNNHALSPTWDGMAEGWKNAAARLRARAVAERGEG